MSDRLAQYAELRASLSELADAPFADLARLHDSLIDKSVYHFHFDKGEVDGEGKAHLVLAMDHSRAAAVVKAMMKFRFPEASDDWFPNE